MIHSGRRIPSRLAAGVLAALALAACGGGGGDADLAATEGTTTTTPATSADGNSTTTVAPSDVSGSTTPGYRGTIAPSARPTSTVPTTTPPSTVDPGDSDVKDADRHVQFAKLDVARRVSGQVDDVRVLSMESVVWPNAALGCPQYERTYDEADVAGYRIELQWKDREFSYHGRDGSDPFLCEKLD